MPEATAKILVADDSESERAYARNALESAGYAVLEAADGQSALEVFARERPDLVMLDVVMPRLTGLETCRILKAKAQGHYLPVIMLSSRNSVNARVEGLRSGADDYLGKPYDPEELCARVEALLRTRLILNRGSSKPGETRTSLLLEEVLDEEGRRTDDPSTKLRRRAEAEFDRAQRYDDPLAMVRVAIDPVGLVDASPEAVESLEGQLRVVIENCVRKIDLVFRRSRPGEAGFTVLLPNTHFPGALAVAERLCVEGAAMTRPDNPDSGVTVSVGVAFSPEKEATSAKALLRFLELALTQARDAGGGRICLYQHQGYLYAPEKAH
jgi:PleD family two-component response regulator